MRKPRLVIPDVHTPYMVPGFVAFLRETKRKYGCADEVICIGDEIEAAALSFHEQDADSPAAGDELDRAITQLRTLYRAFPQAKVCVGNHTARWWRKAAAAGIPERCIKDYREVLEAPGGWVWANEFLIDGVLYVHGTGCSGKLAALNLAMRRGVSCVIGHLHTTAGINYQNTHGPRGLIFGLNVGCGIDGKARCFRYAANNPDKPILGCGVVFDRHSAMFVPMP